MKRLRALRLSAILAAATAAVVLATPATAGQVFRETFHDDGTFVDTNFCESGLTVEGSFVLDGTLLIASHGREGLVYFLEHLDVSTTFTNPANDKSASEFDNFIQKDLSITDNGDGTLTIVSLATGNSTAYGADGKAIARGPGQIRFELLIDHGGTLTDPSDDELLDFQVVKGSTGRSDDFCAALVTALS